MSKRMTKGEFQESLGAFNPVGHAVLAFADDRPRPRRRKALREAGFARRRTSSSTRRPSSSPTCNEMMRNASGAAGFGYEITLMRRYMTLAGEGAGWLVVYAPDEAQTAKVTEIAKRFDAQVGRPLRPPRCTKT